MSEKEKENELVKYLIERPEEVITILNLFWNVPDKDSKVDDIKQYITDVRQTLMFKGVQSIKWEIFYLGMGRTMMNTLGKFDQKKFAAFLTEKHLKYGIEPLFNWRHFGIVHRIDSKLERYWNLKEENKIDNEDQIMDILGYCVLGYLLQKFLMAMAKQAQENAPRIQIAREVPGPDGLN